MNEQKVYGVFCRLCGYISPSTTNSSECGWCGTLEWRTDFLPSQQRIVEFQTRLLIPCRNQTFESVELECTNQTVFSLIKNQSVEEGENCKNCGQPWANSNQLNLERITNRLKPKGIMDRFTQKCALTREDWFDYLTEEDRELVKKYNLYSVFKKGKPEFRFVTFFENFKENWTSDSWWLTFIIALVLYLIPRYYPFFRHSKKLE